MMMMTMTMMIMIDLYRVNFLCVATWHGGLSLTAFKRTHGFVLDQHIICAYVVRLKNHLVVFSISNEDAWL